VKRLILMILAATLPLAAVASSARSAVPAIAQSEIDYLLTFVEKSGCDFYRNGSWFDSRKAQAHLRAKSGRMAAMGMIHSADDFVERAATGSSFSGKAYMVRCHGGPTLTSQQWLRDELARYRLCALPDAKCAPRETRGAPLTDSAAAGSKINHPF